MNPNAVRPKVSHEVEQQQETQRYEASHYKSVSPLLSPDPSDQAVYSRDLTCRSNDSSVHARQSLSLYAELLIDGIGLT